MIEGRDILIYLAIKFRGDWDKIRDTITGKNFVDAKEVEELNSTDKSNKLTILDPEYPEWLRAIYKPPFVLFYYGDISLIKNIDKNIAVVGSRQYSEYGKETTFILVKDICARYVIVSGLARGIDSIAHETAIKNGGKTIAVLGSGIDVCYPSDNKVLYKKIKKDHLLVSEYPSDTPPEPQLFPLRNRIIAGLSKAVLVTEASERSGTLITVHYALAANKDVMCVPHPAGTHSSCNRLISQGAYLVESGEDIDNIMK